MGEHSLEVLSWAIVYIEDSVCQAKPRERRTGFITGIAILRRVDMLYSLPPFARQHCRYATPFV